MELQRAIDSLLKWMHRYVSPVFLALLMASFILWYIAKLSYIYSTEQMVRVDGDGQVFDVTCTVEGVGTNLFGYQVYMNKTLRIPLSALKYKRSREEGHEGRIIIDPQSLQNAISVHYSDVKVVAVRNIPRRRNVHKNSCSREGE